MTARIVREQIPVDGNDHIIELTGPLLKAAARRRDVIELWRWDDDSSTAHHQTLTVRAVLSGQPVPDGYAYAGTAIVPGLDVVYHLVGRIT